jgi:hypothetical protein
MACSGDGLHRGCATVRRAVAECAHYTHAVDLIADRSEGKRCLRLLSHHQNGE